MRSHVEALAAYKRGDIKPARFAEMIRHMTPLEIAALNLLSSDEESESEEEFL